MGPLRSETAPPPTIELSRWFAEEVQPHEPALRAWLRAQFPSLFDVDDLVQESYARILQARRREEIANPKSYLFTTARHAALDFFRQRRGIFPADLVSSGVESVLEERPSAAEALSDAHDFQVLRQAIAALPPRCRDIMTQHKIHGRSSREIAEALGISLNTVNAQMVIGLMRCREYLRARGVLRGGRR